LTVKPGRRGAPGVIEVIVRLFFTFPPGTSRRNIAAIVKAFNENINGKVNKAGKVIKPGKWSGLRYKCYLFKVKLQIRTATPKTPAPAEGELDVSFVNRGPAFIDNVGMTKRARGTTKPTPSDPLSDDPTEMLYPVRGRAEIDTAHSESWAHELGHYLGLDDGYIPLPPGKFYPAGQPIPNIPGHTRDMMVDPTLPVSAQMITRLVRRNKVGDVKCPIKFAAKSGRLWFLFGEFNDIVIEARAEDTVPPSDDKVLKKATITFKGTLSCSIGAYAGDENADTRALFALLGANTAPLAKPQKLNVPITFDITPANAGGGSLQPLTIVVNQGMSVEGFYFWDERRGLPVLHGAMSINGRHTASFIPGPPLKGKFFYEYETKGAKH
jgi:hypothetical protein